MTAVLSHIPGAPTRTRRYRPQKEHALQKHVVTYLRTVLPAKRFRVFAIPNGGSRNAREAANMKLTGTLAGVWDLEIARSDGFVFRIECKADAGRLSPEQIDFRDFMASGGAPHAVVRSIADAECALRTWGLLRREAA